MKEIKAIIKTIPLDSGRGAHRDHDGQSDLAIQSDSWYHAQWITMPSYNTS